MLKNEDLFNLNKQLEQANTEKTILLKEIHHRVKNNLQLVMSLLNIQARSTESTSIEDFLEKGQSRIASMALIHQNLYQTENLDRVNFQEYLENMIENTQVAFSKGEKPNTIFKIDANGNYFDIQTSIPLGLIINELITNALKHAFPEDLLGKIEIELQQNTDKSYDLTISDNGIGISTIVKTKKSLGLELVHLLVSQLKGTVTVIQNRGTTYKINFYESLI